jgi:type I restriction enzyme S subunit
MNEARGATSRADWCSYSLGDLASFTNGRAFKPEEWETTGLPIVRIQNLTSVDAEANYFNGTLAARHLIDDGDLLVSWSASLDAFLWERGPAALNQHIFKVEENCELVDRRFLYYALRAVMRTIRSQIHGSTMQHITKPKFEATVISVPRSVPEQEKLAKALDERFVEISRLQTEAQRQRSAAFSCTGAVLQRALERVHGTDVEQVPLGQLLAKCQYGLSEKADADLGGTPMLRMGNIENGKLDLSDLVHIRLDSSDKAKYRLEVGDVLINRTNSPELVGKSALFDLDGDYVFASYLIRLTPKRDRLLAGYLQALLSSSIGRAYVDRVKHQSVGQSNINATDIKQLPVPLPTVEEQEMVLRELAAAQPAIDSMVSAADQAIEALDDLPEAVLTDVFRPNLN